MKTKQIVSLIIFLYFLSAVFELLDRHFHSNVLLFMHIGLQLLIAPLLFYAFCREQNFDDKSEAVSPKAAMVIFAGVGLMLILIVAHALQR
jgi:hypothetical protein